MPCSYWRIMFSKQLSYQITHLTVGESSSQYTLAKTDLQSNKSQLSSDFYPIYRYGNALLKWGTDPYLTFFYFKRLSS
jgi:hypothetical protein